MTTLRLITFFLLGLSLTTFAYAQSKNGQRILPAPIQVSDHVYMWQGPHDGPNTENRGFRMNMAFVVGKDAVAVIETGFYPAMAEDMVKHIRAITALPIKYAINSNSQPDRFFGNDVYRKLGAKIIAHEKEITRMQINANNYLQFITSSVKLPVKEVGIPLPPDMPVNGPIQIDLGGNVILNISTYKAAHTPSPLIVHVPSDNVIYAGDILYSGRMLAVVEGGDITQWIETYDYLRKFDGAKFIPGHGSPDKLQAFDKSTYAYLTLLQKHMQSMLEKDVDMQDAISRLDQSDFRYLENYKELSGRNANRAYQEFERKAFQ